MAAVWGPQNRSFSMPAGLPYQVLSSLHSSIDTGRMMWSVITVKQFTRSRAQSTGVWQDDLETCFDTLGFSGRVLRRMN